MKFFFDTEFIDNGRTIDLISIGIVAEDGREYYAESSECDMSRACPWVQRHVLPHLTGETKPRATIAAEIIAFVGGRTPEFWAYFGAYDWVVFCQLIAGKMIDMPDEWPMYVRDLQQLRESIGTPRLIEHRGQRHNALDDARWLRDAWKVVMEGIRNGTGD